MLLMFDDLLLFSRALRASIKRIEVKPGQLIAELPQDLQFPEVRCDFIRGNAGLDIYLHGLKLNRSRRGWENYYLVGI
jgi:hypothetical protein